MEHLVDVLLLLRQPSLSAQLSTFNDVYEYLKRALPPLPDEITSTTTEAFDRIDSLRQQDRQLRRQAASAQRILDEDLSLARARARRRALEVVESDGEGRARRKVIEDRERALGEAKAGFAQAELAHQTTRSGSRVPKQPRGAPNERAGARGRDSRPASRPGRERGCLAREMLARESPSPRSGGGARGDGGGPRRARGGSPRAAPGDGEARGCDRRPGGGCPLDPGHSNGRGTRRGARPSADRRWAQNRPAPPRNSPRSDGGCRTARDGAGRRRGRARRARASAGGRGGGDAEARGDRAGGRRGRGSSFQGRSRAGGPIGRGSRAVPSGRVEPAARRARPRRRRPARRRGGGTPA